AGARYYKSERCDGLVAIGGGSSIDSAKGIGVVAVHGSSIVQYEWGKDPIHSRIPPLVAVPTTAGTGSEVTLWAVITDPDRKIKFNVGDTPNIATWVALTGRLLAPVMEYNYAGEPERFARIARALGLDTANKTVWKAAEVAVEYAYQLTEDLDIPSLNELGFAEDEIPMLAKKAEEDSQ